VHDTKPCTPIDRDRRARAFARLESIKRREAFALSAEERLELLEELARFAELAAPHRVPGAAPTSSIARISSTGRASSACSIASPCTSARERAATGDRPYASE
jgi:hypothetical protein